jgi:hypothetical protein
MALASLLVSATASQALIALTLTPVPKGVIAIASIMAVLAGLAAWVRWLRYLKEKQLRKAVALQDAAKTFSYFVQEELVNRELDLTAEAKQDGQTIMLQLDQVMPIVMAVIGFVLAWL